jgi:hypothetical protein
MNTEAFDAKVRELVATSLSSSDFDSQLSSPNIFVFGKMTSSIFSRLTTHNMSYTVILKSCSGDYYANPQDFIILSLL